MDSLLTYPDVNNLSTSSQPIRVRGLFSRRVCWPRPHAVKPASRRSTAPANRAGYLAGVRCGRHASTVKRRVHRSLVAVRCRGLTTHARAHRRVSARLTAPYRSPHRTRRDPHTTRPAYDEARTRRDPHLRRVPVSAGLDARVPQRGVCAAAAPVISCSSWGKDWGLRPANP